jgi:hypothetical protein
MIAIAELFYPSYSSKTCLPPPDILQKEIFSAGINIKKGVKIGITHSRLKSGERDMEAKFILRFFDPPGTTALFLWVIRQ